MTLNIELHLEATGEIEGADAETPTLIEQIFDQLVRKAMVDVLDAADVSTLDVSVKLVDEERER